MLEAGILKTMVECSGEKTLIEHAAMLHASTLRVLDSDCSRLQEVNRT